jgi:hypothetical protein
MTPTFVAARTALVMTQPEAASLRSVRPCEGRPGAAALSPSGIAFFLSVLAAKRSRSLGAARRQNIWNNTHD